MNTSTSRFEPSSLHHELDVLVDKCVDAMSAQELKEFEKKRKKIMAEAESRVEPQDFRA